MTAQTSAVAAGTPSSRPLSFRVPMRLYARLRQVAESERRKPGEMARLILEDWLDVNHPNI